MSPNTNSLRVLRKWERTQIPFKIHTQPAETYSFQLFLKDSHMQVNTKSLEHTPSTLSKSQHPNKKRILSQRDLGSFFSMPGTYTYTNVHSEMPQDHDLVCCISRANLSEIQLPSLKLTARTQKLLVGKNYHSSWGVAYLQKLGYLYGV